MKQYKKTQVVNNILQYADLPVLESSSDDEYWVIEPKYHQRPDKLAHEKYGTENLYYVFLLANMDKMEDPIFDFIEGMEIRVPSVNNVRRIS